MLSFDKCVQEKLVLLCIFAVTPCVGVWIEIGFLRFPDRAIPGHSLRGSVD